jgi:hypothetical protein
LVQWQTDSGFFETHSCGYSPGFSLYAVSPVSLFIL